MRVGILGPLEVRDGSGLPVEVGGTRLRGLLARLALEPGRIVTTATLIDGLWGGAPPAAAANALQALVSRLRRALAPAGIAVDSRPAGYRLALAAPDVDAARVEGLVRDARAAGDPERAAAALREAAALWRGDALADLDELPFAGPAAVHLADLRLTAAGELAEAELALGRAAEAVAVLAPLAARNPLREQLIGRYVRSLQAAGRPAEALAAYEETRRALADELGVDPSPELAALHLALLRGGPPAAAEPPPNGTARRPVRRAALTSFVGRDDEVARVAGMLTAGRLVTVVGPGGAGKTRLAVELADRVDGPAEGLSALVPDGAWPVELAPLRDPQEVAYAVLAALGGADTALMDARPDRPRGRRDATERLVERLADAGLLLILDNCEHLTAAAAAVVDTVLAACPGVRVLATSREPLGVPGEMLAPLPPLGLPPPGAGPERAVEYPAVRLFADRAAAVRPGFAVDAATVDAVGQVCRRLDGMPLAIELAAARLRSLSVGEIADRLDDRFRLLTGGSRTVLPRHQTLRAVVDWSWDLLGEPERAVARRLSVFPGLVTLAAAEEVCADGGLPAVDVVDLVGSLVDKSLVELVDGGDDGAGPARYRLLETIRVYADERLVAAGETAAVRARFVARVRRIVEADEPRLLTSDQLPAMARLTAERDNVVAAVRYAADAEDAVSALRISVGMSWFGSTQGAHAETCVLLEEALAVPGGADGADRTMAYAYLGLNRFEDGDLVGGREAITAATAGLSGTFDRTYVMLAMVPVLAVMLLGDREPGPAELDPLLGHDDPWARAMGYFMRGMIRQNEGSMTAAEADLVEAQTRLREVGERWALASVLSALAEIRSLRGDQADAVAVYEEAIRLATEIKAQDDLEQLTARLASLYARLGDTARARSLLAGLDVHRRSGPFNWNGTFTAMGLAELDRRDGDLAAAERRLRPAWVSLRTPRPGGHGVPPQAVAWISAAFALIRADQGDAAEAHDLLATGIEHAIEGHDMPVLARVVDVAAYVEGRAGRTGVAATLLGAAAALRGGADEGDPDLIALRAVLRDDPGHDTAYATGLAMTRPEAFRFLYATLGAPDPPDGADPGRDEPTPCEDGTGQPARRR